MVRGRHAICTTKESGTIRLPDLCITFDGRCAFCDTPHPRQVRTITSSASEPPVLSAAGGNTLSIDGTFTHSTVDRGANAGVAGLISHDSPERTVDIEGFNHHLTTRLRLGTHCAVGLTTEGEAILIFHQYASHALTGPPSHKWL